ncbi:MAG TPA: IS66 family transposase [Pirellulales bacterium]|jgi:transposase|nr:IS66 family transposase [Pirellulales bacterium]
MATTSDELGGGGLGPPSYQQLLEENRQLKQQVQQLTRQVEQLTRQVEQLRRESKRQAAPFRKQDEPAAAAKKPGRKSGRRHGPHAHRGLPPRIDETYDVRLPAKCPHCGSRHLSETHVASQYQAEIPRQVKYRRFDMHVGVCDQCGRAVEGRHALQTSSARGAAASQLGPNVHALLAILNKQLGLSHGKSVKLLGTLFEGLAIARGTSARSIARTAKRCEPAYEQVRQDIRGSPQVVPDETGWRVGGRIAWLHAFVGRRETCYVIDPTRSRAPAEQLLGLDWSGTLVHDGWSVYDRFAHAAHQQCLGHLQRRCEQLLETASGGAGCLPRAVLGLIDRAYTLRRAWRGHRLSGDDLAERGLSLACELERLAQGRFTHEPNRRLAAHLLGHAMHWFWFLIDPTIDATNYRGEQAIRPAVVNRKVWGGNRTWRGARWQSILTTVLRTCEQRASKGFEFLLRTLCRPARQLLPA